MRPFLALLLGFLLAIVDVRVNGFDVLVDVAGYAVIVAALGRLAQIKPQFALARRLALPLLGLSALDLLFPQRPGEASISNDAAFYAFLVTIAVLVVDLLLVYNVCRGIAELSLDRGNQALARASMGRWALYFVLEIAAAIVYGVGFLNGNPAAVFAILLAILVTLAVAVLGLLARADRELPLAPA